MEDLLICTIDTFTLGELVARRGIWHPLTRHALHFSYSVENGAGELRRVNVVPRERRTEYQIYRNNNRGRGNGNATHN